MPLTELAGMHPATVAVLNEAGYRTLNDIIDLEREDFLRLAGIAPEEADRIIALLDELTTEDTADGRRGAVGQARRQRVTLDAAARGRLLRLVGLGVRGRGAIVGVEQVRESVKKNKVAFAVVATDASRHSLDKVVPLLNARRVRFVEVPSAAELGGAAGRESAAVVGIVDRQLAKGIRELVESGSVGAP